MFNIINAVNSLVISSVINHKSQPTVVKEVRIAPHNTYKINGDKYLNLKQCNKMTAQGFFQFKLNAYALFEQAANDSIEHHIAFALPELDDVVHLTAQEVVTIVGQRLEVVGCETVIPLLIQPIEGGYEIFTNQGNAKNKRVGVMFKAKNTFPDSLFKHKH